MSLLDENPHLRANYARICEEFAPYLEPGEMVPEECALIGLERPPESVFRYFRRLHDIPEPECGNYAEEDQ